MITRSEQHEGELKVAAEIRDFLMESTSLIIEGVSDGARDRGESFLTVLMGQGGPDGQQQAAKQQEQALRLSSVSFAATISRQFFKTLHMDYT